MMHLAVSVEAWQAGQLDLEQRLLLQMAGIRSWVELLSNLNACEHCRLLRSLKMILEPWPAVVVCLQGPCTGCCVWQRLAPDFRDGASWTDAVQETSRMLKWLAAISGPT